MTMAPDCASPPSARAPKQWRLRTIAFFTAAAAHGTLVLLFLQAPPTQSSASEGQEVGFVRDGDAMQQTSSDSAPTDQTLADAGDVDQAAAEARSAAAPNTPLTAPPPQLALEKPDVIAPDAVALPLASKTPEKIRDEAPKPPQEQKESVAETRPQETPVDQKAETATAATAAADESAASAASAERTGAIDGRRTGTSASRAAYGAKVLADVQRHMFYPARARGAGIVGNAVVVFTVGAEGRIVERRITRSSGNDVLDEAALRMLDAVRAPPPPLGRFYGKTTIRFAIRG